MAATTVQPASKTSKKKAAKAIERTESPAPSATSAAAEKASDDGFESPYIKELQKYGNTCCHSSIKERLLTFCRRNIRNVNKKIVSFLL